MNENRGFATGNNVGARKLIEWIKPSYIYFINSDVIVEKDVVVRCHDAIKSDKRLGLVSTEIIGIDGEKQISSWNYDTYYGFLKRCFFLTRRNMYKNRITIQQQENRNGVVCVDAVRGSFMCFLTEAFINAGMFDENTFLYFEENIISRRLKNVGYRVGLLRGYYYIHDHKEKQTQNVFNKNRMKSALYYFKTYDKITLLQYVLAIGCVFYYRCECWVKSIIKRFFT
ncbi:MAG: hypothetical protein ACI4F4_03105 [Lachnospiraceae bacterium]